MAAGWEYSGHIYTLTHIPTHIFTHTLTYPHMYVCTCIHMHTHMDGLYTYTFRIPNISYSAKTKRLAVGARSGQVGIYDLKQGRTQVFW